MIAISSRGTPGEEVKILRMWVGVDRRTDNVLPRADHVVTRGKRGKVLVGNLKSASA